jgi:urease accessory protein
MSAPLGGDRLALQARVEAGAQLRVDSAAATLALPGPGPEPASYDVRLSVGENACLEWLPQPLISAEGSVLRLTVRIDLAPTARLLFRDVLALGRTGEQPGRLSSRLILRHGGRCLLDQMLDLGPGAPGWDSAAVLGGHRAVGQLLIADPEFADNPPEARPLGPTAAVTPLADGPAVLVTAVASNALLAGRMLDGAGRFTTW